MNFDALTEFYFADLLLLICNFLAFLKGRKTSTTGSLQIIKVYVSVSLVFNLGIYLLGIFIKSSRVLDHLFYALMNIYTLAECTFIFLFISSHMRGKSANKILVLIYAAFAIFWIYILIWHSNFLTSSISIMTGIEAFTIVLLCIISFNSMLKRQRVSSFLKSPEFNIMMGIIGYFSYAIPFYLGTPIIEHFSPHLIIIFEVINLILLSAYFLIIRKGFYALS